MDSNALEWMYLHLTVSDPMDFVTLMVDAMDWFGTKWTGTRRLGTGWMCKPAGLDLMDVDRIDLERSMLKSVAWDHMEWVSTDLDPMDL